MSTGTGSTGTGAGTSVRELSTLVEDVSVVIRKENERKILLQNYEGRGYWLPTRKRNGDEYANVTACKLVQEVTGKEAAICGVIRTHITRIDPQSTLLHLTFLSQPISSIDKAKVEADVKWLGQEDMDVKNGLLLSPEPLRIIQKLEKSSADVPDSSEVPVAALSETVVDFYDISIDSPNATHQELLIKSAKLGLPEQKALFLEYVEHCHPVLLMNEATFAEYIVKKGINRYSVSNLFRSFDVHRHRLLSFRDVLLGLAAMEPSTQHGSVPAEVRCRYMFRYYDVDADGFLSMEEFKCLVSDIWILKNRPLLNEEALRKEVTLSFTLFNSDDPNRISLVDFLKAVGDLRFRGTSVLFRLPTSCMHNVAGYDGRDSSSTSDGPSAKSDRFKVNSYNGNKITRVTR